MGSKNNVRSNREMNDSVDRHLNASQVHFEASLRGLGPASAHAYDDHAPPRSRRSRLLESRDRTILSDLGRELKPATTSSRDDAAPLPRAPRDGGARLPDLCAADKGRVARLIQQLLHVGTEHEKAAREWAQERDLKDERFERLKQQNEAIVQETASLRRKFGQTLALLQEYQERILNLQRQSDAAEKHAEEERRTMESLKARERSAVDRAAKAESKVDRLVQQMGAQERALNEARAAAAQRAGMEEQLRHLETAQKEVGRMHDEERRMVNLQREEMQHVISRLEEQLARERQAAASAADESRRLREKHEAAAAQQAARFQDQLNKAAKEEETRRTRWQLDRTDHQPPTFEIARAPSNPGAVPESVVKSLQNELSTVRKNLLELQNEIEATPRVSPSRRSVSPPTSRPSPSKALATIDRLLAIQDGRQTSRSSDFRTASEAPDGGLAGRQAHHATTEPARHVAWSPTRPGATPGDFGSFSHGSATSNTIGYEPSLVDLVDRIDSADLRYNT